MNPKWKLGVLFLLMSLASLWFANAKRNGAAQKAEPDYKDNNCVNCHSGLLEPLRVGNQYLEWQFSRHQEIRSTSLSRAPKSQRALKRR
jgi:hypothetical protein